MAYETFIYNDGGRKASGRKGKAGDCAARAMAIALKLDYDAVYKELAEANKKAEGVRSARNGIGKKPFTDVLKRYGWVWHSAPKFVGRKARFYDLPEDQIVIARMARHISAVVHGQINDTWDCGYKMVYGYYAKP